MLAKDSSKMTLIFKTNFLADKSDRQVVLAQ
jgi:hypothetical protein